MGSIRELKTCSMPCMSEIFSGLDWGSIVSKISRLCCGDKEDAHEVWRKCGSAWHF